MCFIIWASAVHFQHIIWIALCILDHNWDLDINVKNTNFQKSFETIPKDRSQRRFLFQLKCFVNFCFQVVFNTPYPGTQASFDLVPPYLPSSFNILCILLLCETNHNILDKADVSLLFSFLVPLPFLSPEAPVIMNLSCIFSSLHFSIQKSSWPFVKV